MPPRGPVRRAQSGVLWSRLVAPTGTKKHPRVSIPLVGVFVIFFERRGGGIGGFGGVNLRVSYIVLAS